jgi:CRISPR-associated protein Cmr6
MSDIPVPLDTAQAFRTAGRNCRNFGLLFERFVGYGPNWSLEGGRKHDEAKRLVDECNRWTSDAKYAALYTALRERWQTAMTKSANAEPFTATPAWRLVIGLGRESAFETGLTLDRIYGFPYMPGSALKGMTRAYADSLAEEGKADRTRIETLFGKQESSGDAIFFDAIPVTPPRLKLDVMNPHYPDYYRPGDRKPPAGWQSPVPVYFITVEAGTQFLFGVGARRHGDTSQTRQWLRDALRQMGIGGKTTSGYGYWQVND